VSTEPQPLPVDPSWTTTDDAEILVEKISLKHTKRKNLSVTLPSNVINIIKQICAERGISAGRLLEAVLKHYFTTQGIEMIDGRTALRGQYLQLTSAMKAMRKECEPYYEEIRAMYYQLKGKPDGSNRQEIFPELYNHLGSKDPSSDKDSAESRIPFFEQYVEFHIQRQQVLDRLKRLGKGKSLANLEGREGNESASEGRATAKV
jgi:hypothetical protein